MTAAGLVGAPSSPLVGEDRSAPFGSSPNGADLGEGFHAGGEFAFLRPRMASKAHFAGARLRSPLPSMRLQEPPPRCPSPLPSPGIRDSHKGRGSGRSLRQALRQFADRPLLR